MSDQRVTVGGELRRVFRSHPARSVLSLAAIIVTSIAQLVALGSLYPVLSLLSSEYVTPAQTGQGRFAQMLGVTTRAVGLEPTVGALLGLAVLLAVTYAVISILSEAHQAFFVRELENSTREELVASAVNADWAYLRALNHGEFINVVTREAQQHKTIIRTGFLVITSAIQASGLFTLALWMNWRITVCGIGALGLGTLLFVPIFRQSGYLGRAWTAAFGRLSSELVGLLRSVRNVKATSLERYAVDQIRPDVRRVGGIYLRQKLLETTLERSSELLAFLIVIAIVYVGIVTLRSAPSDLMMIMVVFYRMLPQVRFGVDNYQRARACAGSAEIVRRHLADATLNRQRCGGERPPSWRELKFEAVSFGYDGGSQLVRGLTFTIRRGEFWGIVGPTGSGKTTLLDFVLGLVEPVAGRILLGATPLDRVDLAAWHGRIGYLSQDPIVFEGTLRSNLQWGLRTPAGDASLAAAVAKAHIQDLAAGPGGLERPVIEAGNNLSGGEKQRIALARAFLRDPELLILDEPTSALDRESERQITNAILALRGQLTVIAVSHRLEFLESCDGLIRFTPDGVSVEQRRASPVFLDVATP